MGEKRPMFEVSYEKLRNEWQKEVDEKDLLFADFLRWEQIKECVKNLSAEEWKNFQQEVSDYIQDTRMEDIKKALQREAKVLKIIETKEKFLNWIKEEQECLKDNWKTLAETNENLNLALTLLKIYYQWRTFMQDNFLHFQPEITPRPEQLYQIYAHTACKERRKEEEKRIEICRKIYKEEAKNNNQEKVKIWLLGYQRYLRTILNTNGWNGKFIITKRLVERKLQLFKDLKECSEMLIKHLKNPRVIESQDELSSYIEDTTREVEEVLTKKQNLRKTLKQLEEKHFTRGRNLYLTKIEESLQTRIREDRQNKNKKIQEILEMYFLYTDRIEQNHILFLFSQEDTKKQIMDFFEKMYQRKSLYQSVCLYITDDEERERYLREIRMGKWDDCYRELYQNITEHFPKKEQKNLSEQTKERMLMIWRKMESVRKVGENDIVKALFK